MTVLNESGDGDIRDLPAVVEINLQHRRTVLCNIENGFIGDQGAVVEFELERC